MLQRFLLGFVAAALAVVTVHQAIVWAVDWVGLVDREAWSLKPVGPWNVPSLLNAVFWGGLWGSVLAWTWSLLPGREPWLKGLLFGWMVFALANCVAVPLIKGKPLFYAFDPGQLVSVFLILSGFGMATALVYAWLGRPDPA